ncbi:MAG TPA: hypothetical protein VLC28_02325 [Flavitalea sp.]|nr:hypothetical protein [Flavitalea sp.]
MGYNRNDETGGLSPDIRLAEQSTPTVVILMAVSKVDRSWTYFQIRKSKNPGGHNSKWHHPQ